MERFSFHQAFVIEILGISKAIKELAERRELRPGAARKLNALSSRLEHLLRFVGTTDVPDSELEHVTRALATLHANVHELKKFDTDGALGIKIDNAARSIRPWYAKALEFESWWREHTGRPRPERDRRYAWHVATVIDMRRQLELAVRAAGHGDAHTRHVAAEREAVIAFNAVLCPISLSVVPDEALPALRDAFEGFARTIAETGLARAWSAPSDGGTRVITKHGNLAIVDLLAEALPAAQ